jgi:hypothetical protein
MSEKDGKVVFVRCGEKFVAVGDEAKVVTLDAAMTSEKAKAAVAQVRSAVIEVGSPVELRIGGPGMLVGVIAQSLEHIPVEVRYSQLNQLTKQYEIWFSNKENL